LNFFILEIAQSRETFHLEFFQLVKAGGQVFLQRPKYASHFSGILDQVSFEHGLAPKEEFFVHI